MTKLEELIAKLSELFELDKADLDFGIHRIIKSKHKQVREYLETRLPQQVEKHLGELTAGDSASQLEELQQQVIGAFGSDAINAAGEISEAYAKTPLGEKYQLIREPSSGVHATGNVENEVYSHLLEFFSRYYEDADFMSLRRRTAGRESYAIPYNGEEVVLHWANKDQYYIKSSEDLKDYTFTVPLDSKVDGKKGRVQFQLTKMDAVQNNNKASRVFQLDEGEGVTANDDGLVIPFNFSEGKKRANAAEVEWEDSILAALPTAWQKRLGKGDTTYTGSGERNVLQKHLRNYTKKNTSDYFIHKDLGGFLRRELDFYVKNEVMFLDDIESRPANYLKSELLKIKTIRLVANELIDFVNQFEDFQKRIWLKKKFVVDSNYCFNLSQVPTSLHDEVAGNKAQIDSWEKVYRLSELTTDLVVEKFTIPPSPAFLEQNPQLIIDTKYFDEEFKWKLLSSIEDLDQQLDGVAIGSESFHALSLMQTRFAQSQQVVIIDPPYNTGSDGFAYKDTYRNSSWLSFMNDRLLACERLMGESSIFASFVDDNEVNRLGVLLDSIFGRKNRCACAPWRSEPSGGKEKTGLRTGHEYILIYHNGDPTCISQTEVSTGELNLSDSKGRYRKGRELRKWGGTSERSDRPNQWYQLLTPEKTKVLPYKNDGTEGHWRWGQNNPDILVALRDADFFHWEICSYDQGVSVNGCTERWVPFEKIRDVKKSVGWATWLDTFGINADATRELKQLFDFKPFETPKPSKLLEWIILLHCSNELCVVDCFAGSGSTAHAVISANRFDSGTRSYLISEMDNDVLLKVVVPRLKKVTFSDQWKDGLPVVTNQMPHSFKYMCLESYEDALNNLTLEDQTPDLLGQSQEIQDDYLLRYFLDTETSGSLLDCEQFKDPFSYQLKIYDRESGEAKPTKVDLPETFNYLLGLKVRTMQMKEEALVIEGENPAGETVLVIWRNVEAMDNAKLDAFVSKTLRINTADTEYAAIYINGDTTLNDRHKKILLTEQVFHDLMFDVEDV